MNNDRTGSNGTRSTFNNSKNEEYKRGYDDGIKSVHSETPYQNGYRNGRKFEINRIRESSSDVRGDSNNRPYRGRGGRGRGRGRGNGRSHEITSTNATDADDTGTCTTTTTTEVATTADVASSSTVDTDKHHC